MHPNSKSKNFRERKWKNSGFSILIGGDHDSKLEADFPEALVFLQEESVEIRRLRNLPGAEEADIRFGECWPENIAAHFTKIPGDLLLACGQHKIDIVLSQYLFSPPSKEKTKPMKRFKI